MLALLVAGCGGGDDGADPTTATTLTLTKAQFVKKANAICREGQREIAKLNRAAWKKYGPPSANSSPATLNKVALAMLPPREEEVRLLRALSAPEGDEAYIDEMLTAWEEGIANGREEPATLQGGGSGFAFARSFRMGIDYGLVDCWLS